MQLSILAPFLGIQQGKHPGRVVMEVMTHVRVSRPRAACLDAPNDGSTITQPKESIKLRTDQDETVWAKQLNPPEYSSPLNLESLTSHTSAWNRPNSNSVSTIPGSTIGNVEMGAGLEHAAGECAHVQVPSRMSFPLPLFPVPPIYPRGTT